MEKIKSTIKTLKKLANETDDINFTFPANNVNLLMGRFILGPFLRYIASALASQIKNNNED